MTPDSFTPQSLSNLFWALASLATETSVNVEMACVAKLVRHVEAALQRGEPWCSRQELANITWALAQLCKSQSQTIPCGRFLEHLRDELGDDSLERSDFSAQHIANIAWAISTMMSTADNHQVLDAVTCRAILEKCARRMMDEKLAGCMTDGEFSMILWSFSVPGAESLVSPLGTAVVEWLTLRAPSLESCQTLALVCSSLAKVEFCDARPSFLMSKIVDSVAARANALLLKASFRDLSMLAWGLARMSEGSPVGPQSSCVFEAIATSARRSLRTNRRRLRSGKTKELSTFEPRHVSNLIWSYAFLRIKDADLARAIAIEVRRSIQSYNSKYLTTVLWSFAEMGVKRKKFLADIEAAALSCQRRKEFNAQSTLKFLGAYERIGGTNEDLFAALTADRELEYNFSGDLSFNLRSRAPGRSFQNTGVALWEASSALAEWLSTTDTVHDGLVGLELGAGLGLPSFVMASRGCTMITSDGDEEVLTLLRSNVETNAHATQSRGSIRIEKLEWGDMRAIERLKPTQLDVLVAADCVYVLPAPTQPSLAFP